jgi:hypothetical protein
MRQGQHWVAQALEKDLAAQGTSIEDAKRAFERTFAGQVLLDQRLGRPPLEHLPEAPQRFFSLFNLIVSSLSKLDTERMSVDGGGGIPAFMIKAIEASSDSHAGR